MLIVEKFPWANTLQVTEGVVEEVSRRVEQVPGVLDIMSLAGFSMIAGDGSNFGTIFVNLKLWEQRAAPGESAMAMIAKLNRQFMMKKKTRLDDHGDEPTEHTGTQPVRRFSTGTRN